MGKVVYAVADLEVDPSIVDEVVEIVLVNKVLKDFGDLNFSIP